jgi:hypothetical protein
MTFRPRANEDALFLRLPQSAQPLSMGSRFSVRNPSRGKHCESFHRYRNLQKPKSVRRETASCPAVVDER